MQSLPAGSDNSNSPWVTATASKEQVRFASLGIVQRMRLEVLNQARDRVYDSDFREGSLLDWKIEDDGGHRLPDGLYGCVVTVEGISGQSIRRQGVFWLSNGEVRFGNPQRDNVEAAAPVEAQDIVTVLRDEEGLPITHLAHDGKIGRIVSGRGGLSFRVGTSSPAKMSSTCV